MRRQGSSRMSGRALCLLAGCLIGLGHAATAQDAGGVPGRGVGGLAIQGRAGRVGFAGEGPGIGFGFFHRTDGSGAAHGIMIVLNGQDVGASLLKVCDTNQDGAADIGEVKAALLNWYQQADTDTNGALSEDEMATALKSLFPAPPPPPGAPLLPEEHALHNLLAKKIMASVDANNDTWLTSKELMTFVDQSFSKWDADGTGSLDASEFAAAFAQFMPGPSLNSGIETRPGPTFNIGFDH